MSLEQKSATIFLKAKSGPSVFVSKILLEFSHNIYLNTIYDSFHATITVELLRQILWTVKLKIFTFWPFTREVYQFMPLEID